jgi:hypothetical protein
MTLNDSGAPGPDNSRAPRNRFAAMAREEGWLVLALLAAGVLVGIAWRVLAPVLGHHSDPDEVAVGHDTALVCAQVALGVLTAFTVVFLPGPRPPRRVVLTLLTSTVASIGAWRVGSLLGAPTLTMKGSIVIWPLCFAVLITLCTAVSLILHPTDAETTDAEAGSPGPRHPLAGTGTPTPQL